MKRNNRAALFVLALTVAAAIGGCDMLNPVVDEWWVGEPGDGRQAGDPGYLFTQESYVVSFDLGGGYYVDSINGIDGKGPNPAPQRVWAHAHASVPGLVQRDGYSFNDWWDSPTGGTRWNFANDTVENDMTLYAQWEPSGHTVTFHPELSEGGFNAAVDLIYPPKQELIADGALAAEPLHFGLKENSSFYPIYVFVGWYDAQTGGTKWDFAARAVTGNVDLYAEWASVSDTDIYTVTFVSNADKNLPPPQHVKLNDPVINPYVTYRDGYTFGGWYKDTAFNNPWNFATDKADSGNDGDGDRKINLYAKWAPVPAVDILKDVEIVESTYIMFSGGQREYNKPAAPGNATNLTTAEINTNDDVIDRIAEKLDDNPNYRVMIVGHANPATAADKANPQNEELMILSTGRALAVETELKNALDGLGGHYDYNVKTPIKVKAEGGRRALNDPLLSRRAEIIVFEIITEVVSQ